jgi:hypothetical protein
MSRWLPLLVLPWLLAAAPPEPIALTSDEVATLGKGEIVIRTDLPAGTAAGGALGVLDVAAPVDRVIDAILDVEARVGEISGLKTAQVYERTPETVAVRWEVKVLTSTVVFHVRYTVDRATGWIPYGLDTAKSNEIASVEGAYQVYAAGSGSRIVYRSKSDSGRSVPEWLKKWIAVEALSQQLDGIRDRAEAPR